MNILTINDIGLVGVKMGIDHFVKNPFAESHKVERLLWRFVVLPMAHILWPVGS
jgi:hypothetical protein